MTARAPQNTRDAAVLRASDRCRASSSRRPGVVVFIKLTSARDAARLGGIVGGVNGERWLVSALVLAFSLFPLRGADAPPRYSKVFRYARIYHGVVKPPILGSIAETDQVAFHCVGEPGAAAANSLRARKLRWPLRNRSVQLRVRVPLSLHVGCHWRQVPSAVATGSDRRRSLRHGWPKPQLNTRARSTASTVLC